MQEFDLQRNSYFIVCKTDGHSIEDLEVWVDVAGYDNEVADSLGQNTIRDIHQDIIESFNSQEPDVMLEIKEEKLEKIGL